MPKISLVLLLTMITACATVKETKPDEVPARAAEEDAMTLEANPFLEESPLPHGMPPFDRIENEHYLPAFLLGMEQQLEEIELIANSCEAPTFENTIVAMELSGQLLSRVGRVFRNLNSAHTNPELQAVQREVAPRHAAHMDAIFLNERLYTRLQAIYEQRAELSLDAESRWLLERYHTDFVRAGANLGPEEKERLKAINSELASLATEFQNNVLAETNNNAVLVETAGELQGLSDSELATAAEAAAEAGHEGKYLLTLQNTTIQPIMNNILNRELRQRIHVASISRGARDNEYDNREILVRMAVLRAERAQMLGYDNAAQYILEDQTAATPEAVNELLAILAPPARANAEKEAADLQALIDAEGGDFTLQPWDWAFYAEQVRETRYDIDASQLKPYFELNSIIENGLFYSAERLFGISFKERPDLPVYHPDVRVWQVFDEDGTSLGLFLGDFWARDSKRGGAWMNQYTLQSHLLGTRAVVGNHMNIVKPPEGRPTLLTVREVETLFHEFGHAVHGLFSNVRYPRFSGTSVPRDFVEFPSQVYEMWAFWPEVLANYARHYQTGERIPQELLDRVLAARQFNQGYITTEYVAASFIDQAWHQLPADEIPSDIEALETTTLEKAGLLMEAIPPRYHSTYFNHVFSSPSGYAAAYYAYIWSEVLDADSVLWFEENGGLTRENGQRLRDKILSRGGSRDAMELYLEFTGREPKIEPLLIRRGLMTP